MGILVDTVLSNMFYLAVTVCIVAALVFFAVKKMVKIFIYGLIIFAAFLAYIHFTGESVVDKAVEKAERAIK